MLASRDQENLAYARQTTAAGKPLNQSVRVLQPKSPGKGAPKTPFRAALNDENRSLAFHGPKSGVRGVEKGKGNENTLQAIKKNGKLDKSAFVTPIGEYKNRHLFGRGELTSVTGPPTRAPLRAKTTNAKGQAFQTPGFGQQTIKADKTKRPSTTRKSIKSKITVAPSEPVKADVLTLDEDNVPDIEYAPAPPSALADPPEEFEYDQSFPQFVGANLCRGWGEMYLHEPTDEHGVPLAVREYEEKCARYDQEVERQIEESLDEVSDLDAELDRQVDAMIAAGPIYRSAEVARIDTIRARKAVDALSPAKGPSVAMKPTASSLQKSRKPAFSVLGSRDPPAPTNPSRMRHTAAEAVSKNTIGFPRARPAPSIIPPKSKQPTQDDKGMPKAATNQRDIHPALFCELYGDPPEGSDMWVRLRQHALLTEKVDEYDTAGDLFDTNFFPPGDEDEAVFQLPMPL